MAAHRFKIAKSRLTAQVNVNNIADERYYQNSEVGRLGVTPADPRTVLGSIRDAPPGEGFRRKFTPADVALLAETDALHGEFGPQLVEELGTVAGPRWPKA